MEGDFCTCRSNCVRTRRPRGAAVPLGTGEPQTYRILKFGVGFLGLDFFFWQKTVFTIPVLGSRSSFADNVGGFRRYRVTGAGRGGGLRPVVYAPDSLLVLEVSQWCGRTQVCRCKWRTSARVPILEPDHCSSCALSHCLKIHFNIILPSTPGSSVWSRFLIFPHCMHLSSPIRATCPAHLSLLDLITPNNILWGVHSIKLLAM